MFKKVFFLILAALVVVGYSANPTRTAADGMYEWSIDSMIDTNGAYDTLGATDSTSILTNWTPKSGYEYVIVFDAITGTNAATATLAWCLDSKSPTGTLLYRTYVDSIVGATTTAGEAVLLPIGTTCFGSKFTLKLWTYTTSGAQVIINRLYLFKRRIIQKGTGLF